MDAYTKELTGQMTIMSRMRRMSGKMLTMWLASWVLLMLQPCCDSVAGSLPHGHEVPPSGYQHDSGHVHHENAVDAPVEHKHCDNHSDKKKYLPETSLKEYSQFDPQKSTDTIPYEVSLFRVVPGYKITFEHTVQSPPFRRQTYLVTQRLRI